jgi:hypothetical protein
MTVLSISRYTAANAGSSRVNKIHIASDGRKALKYLKGFDDLPI